MTVPTFDGEGGDAELGTSARSYLRRVAAWNRYTKLAECEKALALYTNLSGRAWLFAEELDVDSLGSRDGMAHYLEWVRVRFMEIEINKVGGIINDLFHKCRKRSLTRACGTTTWSLRGSSCAWESSIASFPTW